MSLLTPTLRFAGGTLVLKDLPTPAVRRVFGDLNWQWDERTAGWRIDALEYPAVRRAIQARRLRCDDTVANWQKIEWSQTELPQAKKGTGTFCARHPPGRSGKMYPSPFSLRPEQQAAVDAWQDGCRGLVVMPTGTGKTEVALSIIFDLAVSTLVVAPVRDLMYQWHRRIVERLGYDAGIVGDNLFRVLPVSVTTYDSAYLHMDELGNRFALLVFDECHHLPGNMRRDAARMSAAPWRLGLTATPERADGGHADYDRLIGPVVYELPLAAVRGKTLADYDVVRIPVFLSRTERARYDALARFVRRYMYVRRKSQPGFSWADLCADAGKSPEARRALKAYRAKMAIEDRAKEKLRVLEDLFRLHAGSRTIVFAGSNAMAREVSRRFLIPCLLSHCGKKERLEVLRGVEEGTYPALVANQILDEGVDLPAAKVAVVLGGKSSTRQAKQRLGRILRKAGHERATLYEVVCSDTHEENRSRKRRRNDAYQGTCHRRI